MRVWETKNIKKRNGHLCLREKRRQNDGGRRKEKNCWTTISNKKLYNLLRDSLISNAFSVHFCRILGLSFFHIIAMESSVQDQLFTECHWHFYGVELYRLARRSDLGVRWVLKWNFMQHLMWLFLLHSFIHSLPLYPSYQTQLC